MNSKSILAKFILASLCGYSTASIAQSVIVTDAPRGYVRVDPINYALSANLTNRGEPKYIKKQIDLVVADLPLSLIMDNLIPNGWSVQYGEGVAMKSVSIGGDGNWDEVLQSIVDENGLMGSVDWNSNSIFLQNNDVSETPEIANVGIEDFKVESNLSNESAKVAVMEQSDIGEAQKIADSLVGNEKVDIEKLVFEVDWLEPKDTVDLQKPISLEPKVADKEIDKAIQLKAEHRNRTLQSEYKRAYILPGEGSFEEFANAGGSIGSGEANNDEEYIYVYRQGKLFKTIDEWAKANGFIVKNEIADKNIDYTNIANYKIKGQFKEVTTMLLDKYKNARVPVNHTFMIHGDTKVLHIFESKFESLYVK
ncbi:TPA: hypothetical protein I7730_20410 [Vibrio vulnificus]|uniref:Toxin co-regulated pilus biosynthesis protein Q C-terminal domain-containing protein n=1 Tax=Vibrio vulnificus TaxID=672 RepID=A0A8H9THH5_VIBVL|nr:hypothetical protein [Vibrio vulnificus]HAS8542155.1 hypothetical protein [Vibrio vulnificus]